MRRQTVNCRNAPADSAKHWSRAMTDYVYLIQSTEPFALKIGRSRNPDKRLRKLQLGCASILKLVGIIGCDSTAMAKAKEKELHEAFESLRTQNEWFGHEALDRLKGGDSRFKWRPTRIDTPVWRKEIIWL